MAESTCPFDPRTYAGRAMGMFHCPVCGEMVVAGMAHTPTLTEEEEAAFDAIFWTSWVESTWYATTSDDDDREPF